MIKFHREAIPLFSIFNFTFSIGALHHGCFPAGRSLQAHHLDDGGSHVGQAVGAILDGPLTVLVVDDEGHGVQGAQERELKKLSSRLKADIHFTWAETPSK